MSGNFPKIKRSLCCPYKLMKLGAYASGEQHLEQCREKNPTRSYMHMQRNSWKK